MTTIAFILFGVVLYFVYRDDVASKRISTLEERIRALEATKKVQGKERPMTSADCQWYESALIDDALEQEFNTRWMFAGGPIKAAVFALAAPRFQGLHCYITPAMAALAPDLLERCHATPCPPQDTKVLPLLVGDQRITEANNY